MSKIESNSLKFQINWKITFLSLLFLPILISLGFWQLARAQEKQTILQRWEKQQALEPLDLSSIQTSLDFNAKAEDIAPKSTDASRVDDQSFRQVQFEATLDNEKFWLLEGKINRGVVGYHVVMPAKLTSSNTWLLVNRGWVKSGIYREDIPKFNTPNEPITIKGNLISPSKAIFVGNESSNLLSITWPKRVLDIQFEKMTKEYGKEFLNKVVQIDPESLHALEAFWPKVNVSPAKHQGYAFQWFAMAVALSVLWLHANSNIFSHFKRQIVNVN